MIYTLTLNPSLDHVVMIKELNRGETNRASKEQILAGGKGINVSRVLMNLETDNLALGMIGGHTGEQLQKMVASWGMKAEFLEIAGDTRINTKIKECDQMGKVICETEINAPGPCIKEAEWVKLKQRLLDIEDGSFLVLSGSLPKAEAQISYAAICELMTEKKVKMVVDTTGQALSDALASRPFLIKPNKEELEELFQVQITEKSQVRTYAQRLIQAGARNVIVSMGSMGGVFISETGAYDEVEAPKGNLINSVGAGDSLIAGFLAYLTRHGESDKQLIEAFRYGVATASASAFSYELATKEEADRLYERIRG